VLPGRRRARGCFHENATDSGVRVREVLFANFAATVDALMCVPYSLCAPERSRLPRGRFGKLFRARPTSASRLPGARELPGSRPDTGTAAQDDVRGSSEFGGSRKKSNISTSCDTHQQGRGPTNPAPHVQKGSE
jgi:hypothetical protein